MITKLCTGREYRHPTRARQYTHVCIQCAGIVVDTPQGVRCLDCGGKRFANVPDDQYRDWIMEIKKAIRYSHLPIELNATRPAA